MCYYFLLLTYLIMPQALQSMEARHDQAQLLAYSFQEASTKHSRTAPSEQQRKIISKKVSTRYLTIWPQQHSSADSSSAKVTVRSALLSLLFDQLSKESPNEAFILTLKEELRDKLPPQWQSDLSKNNFIEIKNTHDAIKLGQSLGDSIATQLLIFGYENRMTRTVNANAYASHDNAANNAPNKNIEQEKRIDNTTEA